MFNKLHFWFRGNQRTKKVKNKHALKKLFKEQITKAKETKALDLSYKNLNDISFLTGNGLKQLTFLNLEINTINNISPLSRFKKLTTLYLDANDVFNLTPLIGLWQLKNLSLGNNQIVDIGPISGLGNLETLKLSSNIIYDLTALSGLSQLKELYLGKNQIFDLHPLSGLEKLTFLDLADNQINDLSPLSKLRNLKNLHLGKNIISDLSPLSKLKKLVDLNLGINKIVDLTPISGLSQLKNLHLGDNKIVDLSPLSNLGQLSYLDLTANQIFDLSPLAKLHNLKSLNASQNPLSDLSSFYSLIQLENLFLTNCQIINIYPLSHLISLKVLDLSFNEIIDLSHLTELRKLIRLNLKNNKIFNIEGLLPLFESGLEVNTLHSKGIRDGVSLGENPLKSPSPEIIKKGREAIINYFKEFKNAPTIERLFEAKVLLVGEGGVGKTSLGFKLIDKNKSLPGMGDRTRGISIINISYPFQDSELNLNIWDFGGQDIYHATHRFFLTRRSLYVLLTETRKKEHNFDYWIPNIRLFGKDSPILVVKNMFDGLQSHISIGAYQKNEEFNIVGNIQDVNLKSGEGLDRLETIIRQQAELLPLVGSPVPSTYVRVKERLAEIAKTKPYISLDKYLEICEEENIVDESSARTLAGYLHDLGLVLWYEEIPGLKEKIIVQPEWATRAVYLIIDDEVITAKAGTLDKKDIQRLWTGRSYQRLHDELLLLLEAFKLCYKKKTQEEWVIPSLLPLDPPKDFSWNKENDLIFQFSYTFMPKGMVNQLTAQLDKFIKDDGLVWGVGVVLADGNNEAYVQEDRLKRTVEIRVKGVNPSSFMGILINEMEDIHGTYPGIEVEKFVPCGCGECRGSARPQLIPIQELMEKMKGKADSKWYCNRGEEFVSIGKMIRNVGISGISMDANDGNMFGIPPSSTKKNPQAHDRVQHSELYLKVAGYLTQGDTKKAFEHAISSTVGTDTELFNMIVVQNAAFVTLEKKRLKGTIGDVAYGIELNKIHDGLLGALG